MTKMLLPCWDVEAENVAYDLVIVALGYESRSSFIANKFSQWTNDAKRIAFSFDISKELAYQDNNKKLLQLEYNVIEVCDSDFAIECQNLLGENFSSYSKLNILLDISSFSRFRLATLIEQLYLFLPCKSEVVFCYSVAEFTVPHEYSAPITRVAPLSSFFAGEPKSPEQNLTCVMGLGYEQDRALGAIEFLEIGETIIFKPLSLDSRYDEAVSKANEILLSEIYEGAVVSYEMQAPSRIYSLLDSTAKGLLKDKRIIFIPLGPKLFALIALLVAINNKPNIPVWSVSSVKDKPVDRKATGSVISFSVKVEDI